MKNFIFRKQVGNKGYYVKINFDVELLNEQKYKLEINYTADIKWKAFCETGILLFFEYFSRKEDSGLKVTIYEVSWLPVDTNAFLVLFSTIKALSEALNYDINGLEFDETNKKFIFPDPRLI